LLCEFAHAVLVAEASPWQAPSS